jgi:hypothetical protein
MLRREAETSPTLAAAVRLLLDSALDVESQRPTTGAIATVERQAR